MKRSIHHMMPRRIAIVACLAATMLAGSVNESRAQARKKPTGYVLYRIMTTFVKSKQPHLIEATPAGGKVNVDIVFHKTKCTEAMKFTWKFDRDIRFLRPGKFFNITCTAGGSGSCDRGRNGFMVAGGSEGSLFAGARNKTLSKAELKEIGHKTMGSTGRLHNDKGPHGKSATGTKTVKVDVWKHAIAKRIYHKLWFQSGSAVPGESMAFEIVYLYRAVYGPDQPHVSDDDIVMDNPGTSGTGGTPNGNTGTAPGGNTGTPTPASPCLDPATQHCIDQWLDKMVAILNRRKTDLGPWSISKYGHQVNKLVRSVQTPDGWATKYNSSKYCYVWDVYANEHLDPDYGGELPSLHTFATHCATNAGGASTGGTGTTGGPGTDPGTGGTGTGGTPPGVGISGRTLKAEKRTVQSGDRVLAPIYLLNPDGVANVNFTVTYDPKVAVPDGDVVKGSLLGSARLESNSARQGTIRIGFAQKEGLAQNGIVGYLPFKAVGKAGDKTPLTLAVTDIDDAKGNDLAIKLIHGEIKIASAILPGDCDGDGVLSVADAICALKMSVELMPVNMNLDVNNDGKVTSGDAREIMQRIP